MSIMDAQLLLCESMSIAASAAGSTVSTNVIDLGAIVDHTGTSLLDRPFLNGRNYLNVVVEDEDLLAAIDGSVLTFALYNDSDAVPTTGGDVIASFTVTENTPTEHPDGTQLACIGLPVTQLKRYLGLLVSVATQALSTGKITAWIGPPIQQG